MERGVEGVLEHVVGSVSLIEEKPVRLVSVATAEQQKEP